MGNLDIYLQPTKFFDFDKIFSRDKAFEIFLRENTVSGSRNSF